MGKRLIAKAFVAVLFGATTAALPGIPAAAAAPTTPNGFVGACNMLEAWPGVGHTGVPAGGGMQRAMSVNNPNGDAGMTRAVANSTGSPTTC